MGLWATVTYTYEDFIAAVQKAVAQKEISYKFDLSDRRWENITAKFLELVSE